MRWADYLRVSWSQIRAGPGRKTGFKSIRCHPTERDRWWEGGCQQASGMPVQPLQSSSGPAGTCFHCGSAFERCCDCNRTLLSSFPVHPFICSQVCHHPDCLDLNSKSPLHLCESCDSRCHSENSDNMHFDRHPRFDLQPQGRVAVFLGWSSLVISHILLYYRPINANVKRCWYIIAY